MLCLVCGFTDCFGGRLWVLFVSIDLNFLLLLSLLLAIGCGGLFVLDLHSLCVRFGLFALLVCLCLCFVRFRYSPLTVLFCIVFNFCVGINNLDWWLLIAGRCFVD